MVQEKHQQAINNQRFFLFKNFSSFNPVAQLFSCAVLFSSNKIQPLFSPSNSKESDEEEKYPQTDPGDLQRQWELMHQERLREFVSPKVWEAIKYYSERKDELQQSIIAERALRTLEQESLRLIHNMIQYPQNYPLISSNEQKNNFLEDWLFKHEEFSYCFIRKAPDFFEFLKKTPAFVKNNIVSDFFSINNNTAEKETQRSKVLNFIEEQLDIMNARSELYSEVTSNSDIDLTYSKPRQNANLPINNSPANGSTNSSKPSSKKSNVTVATIEHLYSQAKALFKPEAASSNKIIPDNKEGEEEEGEEGGEIPHHSHH